MFKSSIGAVITPCQRAETDKQGCSSTRCLPSALCQVKFFQSLPYSDLGEVPHDIFLRSDTIIAHSLVKFNLISYILVFTFLLLGLYIQTAIIIDFTAIESRILGILGKSSTE